MGSTRHRIDDTSPSAAGGEPGQATRSRPRRTAPGTGRRPVLTLADRLLTTVLHQRLALSQIAVAALFSVRPETINRQIRETRQLLQQAEYTIEPASHRLATLNDLYSLATAHGITTPPDISTFALLVMGRRWVRHAR
jgi:hypothetical protein